jgi:thiamine-phosphate pyrophosphorylase
MGLEARLRMARLFVVSDSRRERDDLEEFVEAVYSGGADMLGLSEPSLKPSRMVAALEVARTVAFHGQGLVVVDGRSDVAEGFTADVLHLAPGTSAADARTTLHQWALVGTSTSTREEIDAALADPGVDYLTIGPVFSGGEGAGLDLVRYAAEAAPAGDVASKPWFAAGGVTVGTAEEVFAAGARRICVSRPVTRSAEPEAVCQQFKDRLRRLWHDDPAMEHYVFEVFASGLS